LNAIRCPFHDRRKPGALARGSGGRSWKRIV
jgi:hypothetical protein